MDGIFDEEIDKDEAERRANRMVEDMSGGTRESTGGDTDEDMADDS